MSKKYDSIAKRLQVSTKRDLNEFTKGMFVAEIKVAYANDLISKSESEELLTILGEDLSKRDKEFEDWLAYEYEPDPDDEE